MNPKFMFAIVTEDIAGQTIQLFNTIKQAKEYAQKLQSTKAKAVKKARH
jgi:hypothetical protein